MARLAVETTLAKLAVETKLARLAVETRFARLAVDTKLAKLAVETKFVKFAVLIKPPIQEWAVAIVVIVMLIGAIGWGINEIAELCARSRCGR